MAATVDSAAQTEERKSFLPTSFGDRAFRLGSAWQCGGPSSALQPRTATRVVSRMPPLSRFMAFGVELRASLIGDVLSPR